MDQSAASFSLIGFDVHGTPLATLRVQDERAGELELHRRVPLGRVLAPSERPAAQFGRLSVLRSPESVHVMFAIFKAAWHWCYREGLETIVIASPAWSRSIYSFMRFEPAGEAGRFRHDYSGGVEHETMKLPVQHAERRWRGQGQPLPDQYFSTSHPDFEL